MIDPADPRDRAPLWFLFAHGAGAGSNSAWMRRYSEALTELGPVVTFDYTYMAEHRKRPDPLPQLIQQHRTALQRGRQAYGENVVLIGKSMGGRVGCHVALEEAVQRVVCLGYPLLGQSRSAPMRDQVLYQLQIPALFVQGTRDPLCPIELLRDVIARRSAPSALHVVESGDHSLAPTKAHLKKCALTAAELEKATLDVIAQFCARR